jgi:hypothetical protein
MLEIRINEQNTVLNTTNQRLPSQFTGTIEEMNAFIKNAVVGDIWFVESTTEITAIYMFTTTWKSF